MSVGRITNLMTTNQVLSDINQAGTGWYDLESMTITLPGNLTPGTYYVGAVADYNNAITNELSESNNPSNAVAITVTAMKRLNA